MRSKIIGGVLASLALAIVAASVVAVAGGQEPKKQDIRPLMRQKLRHAQFLIEALAIEDFAMIRDNAHSLRTIAGDAQWRVAQDLTYIKYAAEFASIADELERRAGEKDLDGATLSYIRLTINCVDCHKFVKDKRLPGPGRRED